jgi:hypothetical protein
MIVNEATRNFNRTITDCAGIALFFYRETQQLPRLERHRNS